jgi:predicted PurR-regulated permease PerM
LATHFIESNILNPRIVGHVLHLHPVLVLVVLLVAEHFFGVWGLLLGMPVAVYVISHVILGEPIPGVDRPPEKNLARAT